MTRAKDELYRVYFQGTKYSQPCHEVVKLDENYQEIKRYLVHTNRCECPGYERHHQYCRHLKLRDYYEANQRPVCFLRISGSINFFMVPLSQE